MSTNGVILRLHPTPLLVFEHTCRCVGSLEGNTRTLGLQESHGHFSVVTNPYNF